MLNIRKIDKTWNHGKCHLYKKYHLFTKKNMKTDLWIVIFHGEFRTTLCEHDACMSVGFFEKIVNQQNLMKINVWG